MKFCCASNSPIKKCQNCKKKNPVFPKYFQQNRHLKKIQIFRKHIRKKGDYFIKTCDRSTTSNIWER